MKDIEYICDYPTVPIGGDNPYYKCASCGISDPSINGSLSGHSDECLWAKERRKKLFIVGTWVQQTKEDGFRIYSKDKYEGLIITEINNDLVQVESSNGEIRVLSINEIDKIL